MGRNLLFTRILATMVVCILISLFLAVATDYLSMLYYNDILESPLLCLPREVQYILVIQGILALILAFKVLGSKK